MTKNPGTEAVTALVIHQSPAERATVALSSSVREKELAALVARSADILEVVNKDGREQIHRMAMDLKNTRVEIEKLGKAARDDATKFSKAVIAEESRLVAITENEEARLFKLRDDFDTEQERIKAEAARIEAERVAAIRAKIDAIANLPAQLAGANTAALYAQLEATAKLEATEEEYAEFLDDAARTINTAGDALLTMFRAAKEREDAERLRLRLQEEDQMRVAAQAEANRIEAARVAEQQRKLDEQAATMRAVMAQQERATSAVQQLQQLAVTEGAAAALSDALETVWLFNPDVSTYGPMVSMVQMAKSAAIATLTQRLAAKQAEELEAAHAEVLEENAAIDAELAHANVLTALGSAGLEPINWDEPAPLPLPESASVRDAAIDAGEMEGDELKPCPFCGEETDLEVFEHGIGDEDNYTCYVHCQHCDTSGPSINACRDDAINGWNHRVEIEVAA